MVSRFVELSEPSKEQAYARMQCKVKLFEHGRPGVQEKVKFIEDLEVYNNLLREKAWHKLKIIAN